MEQKPISIIISESRKMIEDAINNTRLDPSILILILKDICREVEQASNAVLMNDMKKYNQILAEKETENNN